MPKAAPMRPHRRAHGVPDDSIDNLQLTMRALMGLKEVFLRAGLEFPDMTVGRVVAMSDADILLPNATGPKTLREIRHETTRYLTATPPEQSDALTEFQRANP